MPVYSLTTPQTLNDTLKEKLANMFTDVHCGLTGAPEQFVHVLFSDGIPIAGGKQLYVHANIRDGRTPETVEAVRNDLATRSAEILNIDPSLVWVNLLEISAKWAMEGGYVMPGPGEEDEWMEKVTAALAEREKENAAQ